MRLNKWLHILLFGLLFIIRLNFYTQSGNNVFIENKGQWHSNILYNKETSNGNFYLEKDGFTHFLMDKTYIHNLHQNKEIARPDSIQAHAIKTTFLGANQATIIPGKASSSYNNYFLGKDKNKWKSKVRSYNEITYQSLYKNIDLKVYQLGDFTKYDFIVYPNGNPQEITIEYQGQDRLYLKNGALVIKNRVNDIIEQSPYAYQVIDGIKKTIACSYKVTNNMVSYVFPEGYDSQIPLIIDPVIVFASYSGSTADNFGFTATYDNNQNAYGGGIVFETGQYPVTFGAYQIAFNTGTAGMVDMAISKFSSDGSTLLFSTYLGGGISSDAPHSLVVNTANELFVLGTTGSSDYPVTPNALDTSFNGGTGTSPLYSGVNYYNGSDIVVSKLSADGTTLLASTFIGGTGNDGLNLDLSLSFVYGDAFRGEIILDNAGNCIVASTTSSSDFPFDSVVPTQASYGGGNSDGVAFKLDANLSYMLWGTYIGGSLADAAYGAQLDSYDDVFITGGTLSSNFPVTTNAYDGTHNGLEDGFLCRFNTTLDSLVTATYIGTAGYDQTYFVQLDVNDNVYVAGQSNGDYPVTGNVYSDSNSGQFIHKFNHTVDSSIWSTVVGSGRGTVDLSLTAFLVNTCGFVYLSGWGGPLAGIGAYRADFSSTVGLPLTPDAFQSTTDGTDFYLMVLNNDAQNLLYGTYFGGSSSSEHVDGGTSRFDKQGNVYQAVCAGCGSQDDFPTTAGAVSTVNGSANCNLGLFKFNLEYIETIASSPVPYICLPDSVSFQNNSSGGNTYYWDFGDGDTSNLFEPSHIYQDTGTYNAFLIVSDSLGCMPPDTVDMVIHVYRPKLITIQPVDTICVGDTVQIQAVGGQTFSWTPSSFIINDTVESPFVFPDTTTTFQLISTHYCNSDTGYVTVTVVRNTISTDGDTIICKGSSITRQAYGGNTYAWSPFIEIINANTASPTFTPTNPRWYYVEVTTSTGCVFTDSLFIDLYTDSITIRNDTAICINQSIPLNSTGGGVYSWTADSTLSNLSISNPIATPNAHTRYTVTIQTPNGCVYSDSVNIYVIDEAYTITNDTSVCIGDTITVMANGGVAYSWNTSAYINEDTIANPSLFSLSNFVASVEIAFASGCFKEDSIYISVLNETIETTNDTTICLGSSHVLYGNGGVSYSWSPGNSLNDSLIQSPTATPSQTTTYILSVTTVNGCLVRDSIRVTIDSLVPNPQLSGDTTICLGDSILLIASGATEYYWTPSTSLSSFNQPTTYAFPIANTTYMVEFITACGTLLDSVQVQVNSVNGAVIRNPEICFGDTLVLNASGGVSYFWSSNLPILSPPHSNEILVQPSSPGTYLVEITNSFGCTETLSTYVSFYPQPSIEAGPNQTITYGDYVNLHATGTVGNYLWTPSNGLSCTTCLSPTANVDGNQTYYVEVIDSNGCVASDSVRIYLDGILYVPNTFTPDGDGKNDVFFASGENIETFKLFIFNRWGEVIFETDRIEKGWDGTYTGVPVKTDTYVWRILYTKSLGNRVEVMGHVTLLR